MFGLIFIERVCYKIIILSYSRISSNLKSFNNICSSVLVSSLKLDICLTPEEIVNPPGLGRHRAACSCYARKILIKIVLVSSKKVEIRLTPEEIINPRARKGTGSCEPRYYARNPHKDCTRFTEFQNCLSVLKWRLRTSRAEHWCCLLLLHYSLCTLNSLI